MLSRSTALSTTSAPISWRRCSSGYTQPQYVALDARDNLFVSGSSIYYLIQRIDASTNPVVNPVDHHCRPQQGRSEVLRFLRRWRPRIRGVLEQLRRDRGQLGEPLHFRRRKQPGSGSFQLADARPGADVSFSPTSLTFPATPIGSTSQPLNITMTNKGSNDLVMSVPSISGPFNFVNQSPCPGNIVAPGMTCAYSVTFTPTGDGNAKGTATINDNGFNSSQQNIPLIVSARTSRSPPTQTR